MAKKNSARKKAPQEEKKSRVETKGRYYQGLGRRKSAIVRVKMLSAKAKLKIPESIKINGRSLPDYFPLSELQDVITAPFKAVNFEDNFEVNALAKGGGPHGQAEALRLGISRALVDYNNEYRKTLRDLGYLTRDARVVERKKPGLKKARRAPQWKKR